MSAVTIIQGDNPDIPILIKRQAGSAENITGWQATLTVRKNIGDASAILSVTTPTDLEITDAVGGELTWHVKTTDFKKLKWEDNSTTDQDVKFDLQCLTNDGKTITPIIGDITILREVTR